MVGETVGTGLDLSPLEHACPPSPSRRRGARCRDAGACQRCDMRCCASRTPRSSACGDHRCSCSSSWPTRGCGRCRRCLHARWPRPPGPPSARGYCNTHYPCNAFCVASESKVVGGSAPSSISGGMPSCAAATLRTTFARPRTLSTASRRNAATSRASAVTRLPWRLRGKCSAAQSVPVRSGGMSARLDPACASATPSLRWWPTRADGPGWA